MKAPKSDFPTKNAIKLAIHAWHFSEFFTVSRAVSFIFQECWCISSASWQQKQHNDFFLVERFMSSHLY